MVEQLIITLNYVLCISSTPALWLILLFSGLNNFEKNHQPEEIMILPPSSDAEKKN